jgi:C_GCAxxG_C_C family probable redox protein
MDSHKISSKSHRAAGRKYYPLAFSNLLHMGHCAPTVMKTILDASSLEQEWLVKLSAGMPGGIGNTGHECGAVTSPLVLLGTRLGLQGDDHQLPALFDKGHALCQGFLGCQHTLQCKAIRGHDHFPRHCIPPVLRSAGLYMEAQNGNHADPIPPASREAYTRLYLYMKDNNFHCARVVLSHLGFEPEKDKEPFDAVSTFLGGILFKGGTCSAFTAGVMAIGLKQGEIEDSPLRVIRLLAIMTVDGNAFDDRLNKFNRSMNLGYKLSKWFTKEFGSTQCSDITQCDFSNAQGVDKYMRNGNLAGCREIAKKVADQVQQILAH